MHSAAPANHETRQTLHADHSSMPKLSGKDDNNCKMLLAEIQSMHETYKLREQAKKDGAKPVEQPASVSHVGNNTWGALAIYVGKLASNSSHIGETCS